MQVRIRGKKQQWAFCPERRDCGGNFIYKNNTQIYAATQSWVYFPVGSVAFLNVCFNMFDLAWKVQLICFAPILLT